MQAAKLLVFANENDYTFLHSVFCEIAILFRLSVSQDMNFIIDQIQCESNIEFGLFWIYFNGNFSNINLATRCADNTAIFSLLHLEYTFGEPSPFTEGAVATVNCKAGYAFEDESWAQNITCLLGDANWTLPTSACISIKFFICILNTLQDQIFQVKNLNFHIIIMFH